MIEAKHTPQQWLIKLAITGPAKSKLEVSGIIGTQAKDAIVNVLDLDFDDAHLIAAAPELLEALKQIANAENSALDLAYCKGIARAAIAKATGVENEN